MTDEATQTQIDWLRDEVMTLRAGQSEIYKQMSEHMVTEEKAKAEIEAKITRILHIAYVAVALAAFNAGPNAMDLVLKVLGG